MRPMAECWQLLSGKVTSSLHQHQHYHHRFFPQHCFSPIFNGFLRTDRRRDINTFFYTFPILISWTMFWHRALSSYSVSEESFTLWQTNKIMFWFPDSQPHILTSTTPSPHIRSFAHFESGILPFNGLLPLIHARAMPNAHSSDLNTVSLNPHRSDINQSD